MFFCLNPASVFYSAAYTESLYAAATFAAMLALEWRAYKGFLLAAAASAATRSNGAASLFIFTSPLPLLQPLNPTPVPLLPELPAL